jgi:hypothetical protein
MPRYLIERVYGQRVEEDMQRIGSRAKSVAIEQFPEITWEHSHVVGDESGIKSFCVYDSPDEESLRRHAEVVGEHAVTHIYEIAGDVTPADFRD